MKITIYDLLGLVKEDKAPKKIKCYDEIFKLNEVVSIVHDIYTMDNLYVDTEGLKLFCEYNWQLNDEVEVIEEEKIIEDFKLQCTIANHYSKENIQCLANEMIKKMNILKDAINELKKDN